MCLARFRNSQEASVTGAEWGGRGGRDEGPQHVHPCQPLRGPGLYSEWNGEPLNGSEPKTDTV